MASMHDVTSLLGRLSTHFQNNQLVVSDVTTGIQSAMRSLDRMLIENGPQLAQFYEDFNIAYDHYLGIAFLLFFDFFFLLPPRYIWFFPMVWGSCFSAGYCKICKTRSKFLGLANSHCIKHLHIIIRCTNTSHLSQLIQKKSIRTYAYFVVTKTLVICFRNHRVSVLSWPFFRIGIVSWTMSTMVINSFSSTSPMAHLKARFEGYKNHPVLQRMSVF